MLDDSYAITFLLVFIVAGIAFVYELYEIKNELKRMNNKVELVFK